MTAVLSYPIISSFLTQHCAQPLSQQMLQNCESIRLDVPGIDAFAHCIALGPLSISEPSQLAGLIHDEPLSQAFVVPSKPFTSSADKLVIAAPGLKIPSVIGVCQPVNRERFGIYRRIDWERPLPANHSLAHIEGASLYLQMALMNISQFEQKGMGSEQLQALLQHYFPDFGASIFIQSCRPPTGLELAEKKGVQLQKRKTAEILLTEETQLTLQDGSVMSCSAEDPLVISYKGSVLSAKLARNFEYKGFVFMKDTRICLNRKGDILLGFLAEPAVFKGAQLAKGKILFGRKHGNLLSCTLGADYCVEKLNDIMGTQVTFSAEHMFSEEKNIFAGTLAHDITLQNIILKAGSKIVICINGDHVQLAGFLKQDTNIDGFVYQADRYIEFNFWPARNKVEVLKGFLAKNNNCGTNVTLPETSLIIFDDESGSKSFKIIISDDLPIDGKILKQYTTIWLANDEWQHQYRTDSCVHYNVYLRSKPF